LNRGLFPSREHISLVFVRLSIVGCFEEVPYAQNNELEIQKGNQRRESISRRER